jgi:hypothetical protein
VPPWEDALLDDKYFRQFEESEKGLLGVLSLLRKNVIPSEKLLEFLHAMLTIDAEIRAPAHACLHHRFFEDTVERGECPEA